ncbi:MAG: hypothetical protein ACI4OR_01605 [Alphaproteobacteria bacterium]
MQVKYIVYYKKNNPVPQVDIWKTTGERLHSVYVHEMGISPKDISSEGYLYFNPFLKKWALEHYQMDDGIPAKTLKEWAKKRRVEKRDRLLVRRQIYQTDFLKDPSLKEETWKDKKKMRALLLRALFIQND